jgi:hypothetical protein
VVPNPQPTEPIFLPYSYWDGTVQVELRATLYPYGGGRPGSGVQITLDSRHAGHVVAVRLPAESASRLAIAIMTMTGGGGS